MPFAALHLHPKLVRSIRELGFARPTPIQTEAIPAALGGGDLLASAATGSGKTAAFLLPILHQLVDRPRGTTRALVLAPTRELVLQILDDAKGLAKHTRISAGAVYGGVAMGPQETSFRQGVDLIVATPGRLLDHFGRPYAKLAGLEYLVLDEADRMLDMGFLPDIRRILGHLPKPKQTLFFSATLPPAINRLTAELLRSPTRIRLQPSAAPASGVTQSVYPVPQELKSALLAALFQAGRIEQALVFTRTKHRADRVAKYLNQHGVSADRIHGNRSQAQRTRALTSFKNGEFQVLVATDIAARGIDVEALGHVVNFDVPAVAEDYIHRVGRTARAEATGEAFTFVSPNESAEIAAIERAVGVRLPRVTLEAFDYTARVQAALEVPLQERIAAIRAQKALARSRAQEKALRGEVAASNDRRPRARRFGRRSARG